MDSLMFRVSELAKNLAANRQAISLRTAENLTEKLVRAEGLPATPAIVCELSRLLQTFIFDNWEGAADENAS